MSECVASIYIAPPLPEDEQDVNVSLVSVREWVEAREINKADPAVDAQWMFEKEVPSMAVAVDADEDEGDTVTTGFGIVVVGDCVEGRTSSERRFNDPDAWKNKGQLGEMSLNVMLLNVSVTPGIETTNSPDAELSARVVTGFMAGLPFKV